MQQECTPLHTNEYNLNLTLNRYALQIMHVTMVVGVILQTTAKVLFMYVMCI